MALKDKKKILVVDDEDDLVSTVASTLEDSGYEVITAKTGPEGLKKARTDRPDLILLDIMMPKVDGYQVLAKLKRNEKVSYIPVVMITAKRETSSILKTQEKGASDYLIKPFDAEQLVSLVQRYV
jgi:DNA-binding response OmpR family regulator